MNYNFFKREFEACDRNPDQLAIAGSDKDLSWTELRELSLEIADKIKSIGVPKGHPIMIFGHKEASYAATLLACYHAELTYIPMDSIYPPDRIQDIQLQTGSQLLIDCTGKNTDLHFSATLIPGEAIRKNSNLDFSKSIYDEPGETLQYIMFTSGSTGRPKGVMIRQSSILSFLKWSMENFGFGPDDVFMNQAPFTFDVSLCDFLNALSQGGSLVLNSREILNDQIQFLERLKKYRCSVWTSTPSFAFLYLRNPDFSAKQIPYLKHFLFMGEILPNKTCGTLFQKFPDCKIANAYGPTEASIVTTHLFITPEILKEYPVLPIGHSKTEATLKIDKSNPDDEYGELYIGGAHVARGYFGDPVLTEAKFIRENGISYFKTGDLAKAEKGLWFFAGRNDEQIKLHGYRIELNEINAVMEEYPEVLEACVIALKRNNEVKKIIAFAHFRETSPVEQNKSALLEHLNKKLPYYMVPSAIVAISEFPINNSHKIDKNKLLEFYLNSNGE